MQSCWFLQGADIWELKNSDPGLAIGKNKEHEGDRVPQATEIINHCLVNKL